MILVIDDCRVPPFECVVARSRLYAVHLLLSQDWDEVWWDNDLGIDYPTGEVDVEAKHIAKMLFNRYIDGLPIPAIGKNYIHTSNYYAGLAIAGYLEPMYGFPQEAEMRGETLDFDQVEEIQWKEYMLLAGPATVADP